MKGKAIPPFSVLLIFAVAAICGIALLPETNLSYLPREKEQSLSITCHWQDASAKIMESEVISRIEGRISAIKGIENVTSISMKGSGTINVQLKKRENMDAVRFEISSAIRSIYGSLPEGVSYPEISVSATGTGMEPIMIYTINADLPTERISRYINNHIVKEISIIDGVRSIALSGASPLCMEIIFDPDRMFPAGIDVQDIYDAVLPFTAGDMAVGSLNSANPEGSPDMVLKTSSGPIEDIPVMNSGGRIIRLSDIAEIRIREEEPQSYYRVNGLNTINLTIYPEESSNTAKTCREVSSVMESLSRDFPQSFSAMKSYDISVRISRETGKLMRRTALCIAILLIFIAVTTRSLRYTFITASAIIVNLAIAVIFYILTGTDIHIYSLAGISISLSLIIDSSIIMVSHYSRYRDRKAFMSVLAAQLTTIGSLAVIFLLPDEQKRVLGDFSAVIIINLVVSVLTALFFVPAMLEYLPVKPESISFSIRRRRRAVILSARYEKFIFALRKRAWAVCLVFAAVFICSLMLFRKSAGGFSSIFKESQRPVLYISAGLPEGCNIGQLDAIIGEMENFLAGTDGIKIFRTSITSYRYGNITVEFTDAAVKSGLPASIKQEAIKKAIGFGGANWSIYGIDERAFNNYVGPSLYKSSLIRMSGYNYDMLYSYCTALAERLEDNPRIKDISIDGPESFSAYSFSAGIREFSLTYNHDNLALYGITPVQVFSALENRVYSSYAGSMRYNGDNMDVRIVSGQADEFDVWHFGNEYVRIDSTLVRFNDIGDIRSTYSGNNIYRENQEYILYVRFNFTGSANLEARVVNREIERLNSETLPIGFRASSPEYEWAKTAGKQWGLLLIVAAIIYLICAVLFESLRQPVAIISLIPASFIGIFLIFRITGTNFDQGGFASMVMLSGIAVNSGIYIVNEYNRLPARRRNFTRAFNHKIIPVCLTVLSTVLGLLPFLSDGRGEMFWFPFAIGTIGGMLFSFTALTVLLPILIEKKQ